MKLPRTFILGLCLLPLTAAAADVYRWVDANGQVHFGDKPPNGQAQTLHLPDTPSDSAAGPGTGVSDRTGRLLRAFEEERKQKEQAREQAQKEQATRKHRCYQSRDALRYYNQGGGVYRLNDKGEREYLSESERDAYVNKWRQAVKKWCVGVDD